MDEQFDKNEARQPKEQVKSETAAAAVSARRDKLFRELYDWVESAVFAVIFVVLLFTFVARTSVVSGRSMYDTLDSGDMLIVSRLGGEFKNGDIVVATKP